jgi:hypothetical protein
MSLRRDFLLSTRPAVPLCSPPVSASLGMGVPALGLCVHVPGWPDPALPSVDMSMAELMIVPVRTGSETVCLRCGQLPTGERVGIAFTTQARLAGVMGAGQAWIRLSDRAMKEMLASVGVARIQVDPGLVAESLPVSVPA